MLPGAATGASLTGALATGLEGTAASVGTCLGGSSACSFCSACARVAHKRTGYAVAAPVVFEGARLHLLAPRIAFQCRLLPLCLHRELSADHPNCSVQSQQAAGIGLEHTSREQNSASIFAFSASKSISSPAFLTCFAAHSQCDTD